MMIFILIRQLIIYTLYQCICKVDLFLSACSTSDFISKYNSYNSFTMCMFIELNDNIYSTCCTKMIKMMQLAISI